MAIVNPVWVQTAFRGRNDDGSETSASWIANVDTNWSQSPLVPFRVRFLVDNASLGTSSGVSFRLQYNLNGGGWNDVSSSSDVLNPRDSLHLTEAEDTTVQLGTGSFIINNDGVDEVDGLAGNINSVGNDFVEVEYSLLFRLTDVLDGDLVELRLVLSGGELFDTYVSIPTITIVGVPIDISVTNHVIVSTSLFTPSWEGEGEGVDLTVNNNIFIKLSCKQPVEVFAKKKEPFYMQHGDAMSFEDMEEGHYCEIDGFWTPGRLLDLRHHGYIYKGHNKKDGGHKR